MLLNPIKTDAMMCGTHEQRQKIDVSLAINVAGAHVSFGGSIKLLGVELDSALSMDGDVSNVVRGCNYHIRALRRIRPLLDHDTAKVLGKGIVAARLDYCNSWMYGMSNRNFKRLQVTQNALTRAVCTV